MTGQSIGVPVRRVLDVGGEPYTVPGFLRGRVLDDGRLELELGDVGETVVARLDLAAWDTFVRVVAGLREGPLDAVSAARLLLGR